MDVHDESSICINNIRCTIEESELYMQVHWDDWLHVASSVHDTSICIEAQGTEYPRLMAFNPISSKPELICNIIFSYCNMPIHSWRWAFECNPWTFDWRFLAYGSTGKGIVAITMYQSMPGNFNYSLRYINY